MTLHAIANEVHAEIHRAWVKFGPQHHLPNGTGGPLFERYATLAKRDTDEAAADGRVTWQHVLQEEVYEAFAETDPGRLRTELLQVAAVAMRWVDAIDTRYHEERVEADRTATQ